jgi:hypothetical protein
MNMNTELNEDWVVKKYKHAEIDKKLTASTKNKDAADKYLAVLNTL